MAHDVFISHSSKDKQIADAMCNKLESSGIRCWMAPRDILPGLDWGEAIVQAINNCRLMILVFSANANGSHQIKREVERAASKQVPIMPFRIEDVEPSGSLEYYLGTPHWLDALTPPVEQHLQRLIESVNLLLSMLPKKRAAGDDEEITLVGVEENGEASRGADRAREEEEARRRAEDESRRRNEETARRRAAPQLKRRQQEADAEPASKAQDAPSRGKDEGSVPERNVAAQDKELAHKRLNRMWGWGLSVILISSFVITIITNAIKPVAIGLFLLCPIFSLYVILKERKIRSGKG